MNTLEPVTFSVSPVPFVADRAELRGLKGVFYHKLNPLFLALPLQQLHQSAIKPMRQPPVKHARKRPSRTVFNLQQVLNTKDFYRRPVNGLQSMTQQRFNFSVGIFLSFLKILNPLIKIVSNYLGVAKHHTVFVIGIHADNLAFCFQGRSFFLKDKVNPQSPFFQSHTDGFRQLPSAIHQNIAKKVKVLEK